MSQAPNHKPVHTRIMPGHIHGLGAVGLLTLGGIAYAFGISPSLRAETQAASQREAIVRAGERVRALRQDLGDAQVELDSLESVVGDGTLESERLVGRLTEVAAGFGLTPMGVDRSSTELAGDLVQTRLTLNAVGSFSDIDAFVSGLRAQIPTASIDGFAIVPAPMESQGLALVATVLVYAPQPSASDASAARANESARSDGQPDR